MESLVEKELLQAIQVTGMTQLSMIITLGVLTTIITTAAMGMTIAVIPGIREILEGILEETRTSPFLFQPN
ncbi:hypothetical protein [Paenibacillus sp. Soil766]|uniref:hypothetical protein n=1 Tax=Paenibacillus sp. Soil766 TaxID=1736404 RepID=UPI0012F9CE10|nr:hypothetical protein [Paenibacillus sp. Soil766]